MEPLESSAQPAVSGEPLEMVELQSVQVLQPQAPANSPEDEAVEPLSPGKNVGVRQKWQEYLNLRKAHWPKVPDVFIKYENLAYEVEIPKKVRHVQTIFSAARNFARRVIGRQASTKILKALSPSTGSFAPGTMTLIMSEPGGGTSTFLKLLAGQVPDPKCMSGKVLYNGHTLEELDKIENALKVPKAVAYVDQEDNHMSLLTVRETLDFAKNLMCIEPHYIAHPELIQYQKEKVEQVIELLGLNECADTIVGNDFVRGVSGGQKKRVSIAEMLMGEARVLLFDEITTGLDSAVAFDILSSILQWVETLNATVVAGLLQPTPEVYGLFHNVILMRSGKILYHGPRTEVPHYMAAIGVPIPEHMDEADFITEFLSNSQYVAEKYGRPPVDPAMPLQQQQLGASEHKSQEPQQESQEQQQQPQEQQQQHQPEQEYPVPDITTPRLQEVFEKTPAAAALKQQTEEYVPRSVDMAKLGDFARLQYGQHHSRSFKYQTKLSMFREFTVMSRDRTSVVPRVMQAIIMSLVLGTLFWDLGVDKYYTRIGLIMYASLGIGFGSMVELPSIMEQKRVLLKHNAAKMMRVPSFVLSVDASHMVVGFLEVLLLGVVLFWMTNMVPDAGRFLTWIALLIALSFAFGGFFRLIAAGAKDQPMAQLLATPFIMTFVIFSGFLVSRDNIPGPFIVFYWLSPVSWMLRALALNEFKDPERYGRLVEVDGEQVPLGDYYLETMEFPTDSVYIWLGFGFLCVWWLLSSMGSAYSLSRARRHQPGTQRLSVHQDDPDDEIEFYKLKGRDVGQKKPSTIASVGFTPANLVWKDVRYQVQVGKKQYKTLLRGVSGHCTPGTLTAMLGASGAGKSTLMDVIAGRKTGGIIEGEILVNGVPKDPRTFGRIAGYVEQQDIHNPTATVREALLFAAKLRLPQSVPHEQRLAMVDEVLDLLELTEIQHRVIGGQMIVGLAPGEKKRVTIGVELIANPSILFLDEPTSGIDSRAAMEVVRVLKRIAATGRSVLCTIHQPSTELFSHFDRLLLLSPGGRQVYFGSNEHIRSYFEAIPGTEPCGRQNPATWILNVVGDSDENPEEVSKRFSKLYQESDLIQYNREEIDRLGQESAAEDKLLPDANSPSSSSVRKHPGKSKEEVDEMDRAYATSLWTQLMLLNLRSGRGLVRSVRFSLSRLMLLMVAGILFGVIYYDVASSTDFAGVNSVVGLVFISGTFGALIFCSTSLPYLFEQRAVFYRESSSNTYSKWSYAFSLFFPDWPYIITGSIVYTLPLYFLAGFKREFAAYIMYWLATVMMMFTFVYLGQVLSSTLPNLVSANAIQGLTFNFVNLFGGLFIYYSDMPVYWVWFYYLNPVAKGIQCFLLTQYDCQGPDCPTMDVPEQGVMTVSDFVSMNFNYDYDDYWSLIGYVAITAAVLYAAAVLALRFVNHLKR